jgi:hypothetical protein
MDVLVILLWCYLQKRRWFCNGAFYEFERRVGKIILEPLQYLSVVQIILGCEIGVKRMFYMETACCSPPFLLFSVELGGSAQKVPNFQMGCMAEKTD